MPIRNRTYREAAENLLDQAEMWREGYSEDGNADKARLAELTTAAAGVYATLALAEATRPARRPGTEPL